MIDPICGMEVDPSNAAESYTYNGQTYHFCSHRCLTKFKEDPERFLKGRANEHAAPAHEHAHVVPQIAEDKTEHGIFVCPMDAEVRSVQPDRAQVRYGAGAGGPCHSFGQDRICRAPGARLLSD